MGSTQKFEFTPERDGSQSRRSLVMQALGAASVCWDYPEGAGTFRAERAKEIGEALLEALDHHAYSDHEALAKRLADAFATADGTGDTGERPGFGLVEITTRGPSYKPAVDAALSVLNNTG